MKKALKNLLCLILLVASTFNLSSCFFSTVDMSLPLAVFDENDNIIYNGCAYYYTEKYVTPNNDFDYFNFKNGNQALRTTTANGFPKPVYGYGLEDFGEYVCFGMFSELVVGEFFHIKEGFEFPDVSDSPIDYIYCDFIEQEKEGVYIEVPFDAQTITINDIIDRDTAIKFEQSETADLDSIALLRIHFGDYNSISMTGFLHRFKNEFYLNLMYVDYKIKAEYVEIFENALNN